MLFFNDIFYLLPDIYLFAVISIFLLFSVYLTQSYNKRLLTPGSYLLILNLLYVFLLNYNTPILEHCIFNTQILNSEFTYFIKLFFIIFLVTYIIVSTNYFIVERIYYIEYFFFIGLITLALFFLLSANDFLLFYILVELQSLILYTLATMKRFNTFSTEAGLKYFILGALSSGLFLFGISVLYGFTGLTNFFDLRIFFGKFLFTEIATSATFLIFLLISSIFLFKIAAAPFHIWTPDVYEGIPYAMVLFFGTLPKLVLLLTFIKILFSFFYELYFFWHLILFITGMTSIVIGTIAGLNQYNMRKLYAYSAITNIGYFLIILSFLTFEALETVLNYLIIYFTTTLILFVILLNARRRFVNLELKNLSDFILIFKFNPLLATLFGLIFFSMAGIPPLGGFFAKFFLFNNFFTNSYLNFFFVLTLVLSVMTAIYYIRCVHFTFFDNSEKPLFLNDINYSTGLIISLLSLFIFFFAFLEPTFFLVMSNLALDLFI